MLMTEHREILPKKSAVFTITAALNTDRLTWTVKCISCGWRVSAPMYLSNLLGRWTQCSDPGPDSCIRSRNSCRRFLVFWIQLFSSIFYVKLRNPKISTSIEILLFFTHKQFCCDLAFSWYYRSNSGLTVVFLKIFQNILRSETDVGLISFLPPAWNILGVATLARVRPQDSTFNGRALLPVSLADRQWRKAHEMLSVQFHMWLGMLSDDACENHWNYLPLSPTEFRILTIDLFLVNVNIAMWVWNDKRMKKEKNEGSVVIGHWSRLFPSETSWLCPFVCWKIHRLLLQSLLPQLVLVAVFIQLLSSWAELLPAHHMTSSASWLPSGQQLVLSGAW